MNTNIFVTSLCGALLALLLVTVARAQAPAGPLKIKAIAEVESRVANPKTAGNGSVAAKLVPATQVELGDRVIYTLEVRNPGTTAVESPSVAYPIPEHMRYIADSAVGPGAEVSYSVDGGRSFDHAENLNVQGPEGRQRPAVAADYTDIRWQLKNSLKANSVAFVRFRALVK